MKIEPGNKPRVPTPAPKPTLPAAAPAEARKPTAVQDGFDNSPARASTPAPVASSSRPPASRVEGPPLPQAVLDRLGDADKARLLELARGGPGTDARTNLGGVMGSPGFQRLNAEQQAQTLRTFLAAPPSSPTSTRHLTSLLGGAGFQSLSPADKTQVLDVFRQSDVDGRKHLVELSHRTVNGRTALLDTDTDGHTLLSNLQAMATGQLEPSLASHGIPRAGLLCSVMREASSPEQRNPAEYVRILRGLTSPSGRVRLRNGDTLRRDPDSIPFPSATQRSASERLFQAAGTDASTSGTRMDKGLVS